MDYHHGGDYVKRHAIDLGAQLMSGQAAQSADKNEIGAQLQNIMLKIAEMNNEHRLGGQRTEELEYSFLEIRRVIARETRGILEILPTIRPWRR